MVRTPPEWIASRHVHYANIASMACELVWISRLYVDYILQIEGQLLHTIHVLISHSSICRIVYRGDDGLDVGSRDYARDRHLDSRIYTWDSRGLKHVI